MVRVNIDYSVCTESVNFTECDFTVCVCVWDALIGLYVQWCSQCHIRNAVRSARRLQHTHKAATTYLINFHILKHSQLRVITEVSQSQLMIN